MDTLRKTVEKNRMQFENTFRQDALRKNGTANKEYLDWLEGFMAKMDNSCKGCRDYNNGTHTSGCKSCRRYCADLYKEK